MRPAKCITEACYFRELRKYTDRIYDYAAKQLGWGWEDLASAASLSKQTVFRLGRRETKWPRFSTFWKLAQATGLELQLRDADGNLVRLPRKRPAKKVPRRKAA